MHFLIIKEVLKKRCFWNITKKMLVLHFHVLLVDEQAHPVYSPYPSET